MPSLESSRGKLAHAKSHLEALLAEERQHFEQVLCRITGGLSSDRKRAVFTFEEGPPVSSRFALIAGDVLQNIRSSLDYLVWDLALIEGQPDRQHMFPICDTEKDYRKRRPSLRGIPEEAVTQISAFQPFHLGEKGRECNFWALNELTNITKHRRLLLTVVRADFDVRLDVQESRIHHTDVDHAKAYIALDEGFPYERAVCELLQTILDEVERVVLPQFARFFSC